MNPSNDSAPVAWTGSAIIALALLSASAVWTGSADRARVDLARCLADPQAHRGVRLTVHREARVLAIEGPGRARVCERGLDRDACASAVGVDPGAATGDWIAIEGLFDPPDRVLVERSHTHRHRALKVLISLPGAVLVAVWFLRAFRPGRRGWEERGCPT